MVFANGNVLVKVSSTSDKVLSLIGKHWCAFWAWTNMGTRQTKGFGSFYPDQKHAGYSAPSGFRYHFHVNVSCPRGHNNLRPAPEELRQHELFRVIDLFHRSLRSGINLPGRDRSGPSQFYFKALMFSHAMKEGYKWDKRVLKEKLLKRDLKDQHGDVYKGRLDEAEEPMDPASPLFWDAGKSDPLLWRDMLGLSTHQSWGSYRITLTKTHTGNNAVQRMRSPIHYKPLRVDEDHFVVFLGIEPAIQEAFTRICTNAFSGYLSQPFTVKLGDGELEMKTLDQWDPEGFLTESFQGPGDIRDQQVKSQAHRNHSDAKTLAGIFEQLADQVTETAS
jgi:hypothetical protein